MPTIVALLPMTDDLTIRLSNKWLKIVRSENDGASPLISSDPSSGAKYLLKPEKGASRSTDPSNPLISDLTDVVLIMGLSHGTGSKLQGGPGGGDLYDPDLLKEPNVQDEVRGKIVHLLACATASANLGADFQKAGCSAFIGYDIDIAIDAQSASDDWITEFVTCDLQVEFSLARGNSVEKAVQDAQAAFNKSSVSGIRGMGGHLKLLFGPGQVPPSELISRITPSRELPEANETPIRAV